MAPPCHVTLPPHLHMSEIYDSFYFSRQLFGDKNPLIIINCIFSWMRVVRDQLIGVNYGLMGLCVLHCATDVYCDWNTSVEPTWTLALIPVRKHGINRKALFPELNSATEKAPCACPVCFNRFHPTLEDFRPYSDYSINHDQPITDSKLKYGILCASLCAMLIKLPLNLWVLL